MDPKKGFAVFRSRKLCRLSLVDANGKSETRFAEFAADESQAAKPY
jgi:hypothetical protein